MICKVIVFQNLLNKRSPFLCIQGAENNSWKNIKNGQSVLRQDRASLQQVGGGEFCVQVILGSVV